MSFFQGFQLFFKSIWRLDGREFHAFGPAYEKLGSPNLSLWGFILEIVGGLKSLMTVYRRGCPHINQVGRTVTDAHQVLKHAQFVLIAQLDRVMMMTCFHFSNELFRVNLFSQELSFDDI